MSFLGSIVSDISKAVTDPGGLISDAAKAILPKNMSGIGDILGGIADIETGHPLQSLSHITDALKDLPQLLQGQAGAQANAAARPAGTAGAEPSPPPQRVAHAVANNAAPASNAAPATNGAPAASATPTAGASPTTTAAPAASASPATSAAPATTTSAPATSAPATPAPPASSPTTPSSSAAGAHAPSVTVRRFGNETITRIDDGKNTTVIDQKGRHTRVSVRSDAPPSGAGGASATNASPSGAGAAVTNNATSAPTSPAPATGSGSSSTSSSGSSGSAHAPSVTVQKFGSETITQVDDGTNTTIIGQRGGRTTVTVKSDTQPPRGWHAAPLPAGSAAGASAPATSNASAVSTSSTPGTAPSTSSASIASATRASGAAAANNAATSSTTAPKTAGAASANGTADSAASANGSSAATPKDLASLMALSPDQFMQAVTSGKIPPDVANNQSAMMQVQARMNSITQMNQLVTSMMAAMHQMQMSIIQNIRC
jgi:hypothetical protein